MGNRERGWREAARGRVPRFRSWNIREEATWETGNGDGGRLLEGEFLDSGAGISIGNIHSRVATDRRAVSIGVVRRARDCRSLRPCDWKQSLCVGVRPEEGIRVDARRLCEELWKIWQRGRENEAGMEREREIKRVGECPTEKGIGSRRRQQQDTEKKSAKLDPIKHLSFLNLLRS